jgi:thioredoxin 1
MDNNTTLPKSFFDLIQTSDKPVLVDFWAAWCGPCRMVSPTIEQIAREYGPRLLTIKINVDQKQEIAAQYQVQSIPTIMMFWKGAAVMRIVGAAAYDEIKRQIEANWPVKP